MNFSVGDVVTIDISWMKDKVTPFNDMTVVKILPDGRVGCQWFVKDELQEGVFDPDGIVLSKK